MIVYWLKEKKDSKVFIDYRPTACFTVSNNTKKKPYFLY